MAWSSCCWRLRRPAAEPPALAKARALYNAGSYDAAIDAATSARSDPPVRRMPPRWSSPARTSSATALSAAPQDLTPPATALGGIRVAALSAARSGRSADRPRPVAVSSARPFGAAAELFDTRARHGRRLLRAARSRPSSSTGGRPRSTARRRRGPPTAASPLFARIVERMEEELRERTRQRGRQLLARGRPPAARATSIARGTPRSPPGFARRLDPRRSERSAPTSIASSPRRSSPSAPARVPPREQQDAARGAAGRNGRR